MVELAPLHAYQREELTGVRGKKVLLPGLTLKLSSLVSSPMRRWYQPASQGRGTSDGEG